MPFAQGKKGISKFFKIEHDVWVPKIWRGGWGPRDILSNSKRLLSFELIWSFLDGKLVWVFAQQCSNSTGLGLASDMQTLLECHENGTCILFSGWKFIFWGSNKSKMYLLVKKNQNIHNFWSEDLTWMANSLPRLSKVCVGGRCFTSQG